MIQFKTPRIQEEYNELPVHNPKLKRLLVALAEFVSLEFNKDVVITELFRTPEDTANVYKDVPKEQWPKGRPHEHWQAADLRSSVYTPQEITRMLAFLNQFKFYNGTRSTAIYHTIQGNVMHFHVQYGLDT